MNRYIDAVWEDGVFRPLEPVSLPESQRVTVTIEDTPPKKPVGPQSILEMVRMEVARGIADPTIEEVRAALASIPGNLSDAVDEDRGEY